MVQMTSLTLEIKQKLTEKGASLVGFADIADLPSRMTGGFTAAIMKSQEGQGLLDILDQWQCPDPLAKVIFKIEEEKSY